MIRYKQRSSEGSNGLGYQLSIYALMRNLCNKTGFKYTIHSSDLNCLKHTFNNLKFDGVLDDDKFIEDIFRYSMHDSKFEDYISNLQNILVDDSILEDDLYASSIQDPYEYCDIINDLEIRDEIYEKCKIFMKQFKNDRVVALHIRRREHDFKKFLIDIEYYREAVRLLPKDYKILVFCNLKDYVLLNSEFMEVNPERFIIISDIFNDNQFINCDVGQELDILIDNDPSCKYDYKLALLKLSNNNLINRSEKITKESLNNEMKMLIKELHPKYKYKIQNNFYNYSFEFCLMTMCRIHIISNSLFSFWAAFFADSEQVIYPKYWRQPTDLFVSDLSGINQSGEYESQFLKNDNFIPIENPDERSFKVKEK